MMFVLGVFLIRERKPSSATVSFFAGYLSAPGFGGNESMPSIKS